MKKSDFVHLHVHSDYSLLDGACRTRSIAEVARREGMRAAALTDHGNLFGAVNFYQTALEAGVKPVIGYEAYVAPGGRRERDARSAREAAFHLTLLAMDEVGYANLVKLASLAYLEGFYYKPRIDKELLGRHSDGLICLSGCGSSEICRHLLNNDPEAARKAAQFYRDVFGPERFYIELQDNGLETQRQCLNPLADLAKTLGLKAVATNDVHYMTRDDALAQEALLCVNTGTTLSTDNRLRLGTDEFYFKSAQEMQERFAWMPEALTNTLEVADRCNVEIAFDQRHFPHFVPEGGLTPDAKLRQLCEVGLQQRYPNPTAELRKRLKYELDVIDRMRYASYFLIVWDIVRFARDKGIRHGLRGSGVGSLVSYVLHLGDIDPIAQELLFERFMDPLRREAPDLDLDFCAERRDEVITYVKQKYGEDHTAQIITFGTLAARGVVRDVARVLEIPLSEVDQITRLIPMGPNVKLKDAVEREPKLKEGYENDPRIRRLIDISLKLEGLARHASTHAAGVVMADKPLIEYVPLYKANGIICSQFEMDDLARLGLLKIDLLGLRELTIVDKTLDLVEQREGRRPDVDSLPLDDEATYEFLCAGDTRSVFQLGSEGMRELLHRLEPRRIDDLTAIVALYRPAPLEKGVPDEYIKRKHAGEEITYPHPSLEPILKSTYGLIVYQEQIMRIAHQVAGMDLGDALTMIKAISKKKGSVIEERRERFLAGARRHGLSEEAAERIFDAIAKFAQYGFNKAHAVAYAYLAYKTAYLKAHYPVEFLAAAMTCDTEFSDKVARHADECPAMGIELLPPSINESEVQFTVAGPKAIRFGLGAVRNAGRKGTEEVVRARQRVGKFESLYQFCEEVDLRKVNRQAVESLIKAGAFDGVPGNRAQKVAALDEAMRVGSRIQQDKKAGQATFFGALEAGQMGRPALPQVAEWPRLLLLTYEKEALGFYLSGHPLDSDAALLRTFATATSSGLPSLADGTRVVLGGMVKDVRQTFDKRGQTMAFLELEDLEGTVQGVLFSSVFEKYGRYLAPQAHVFLVARADVQRDRTSMPAEEVVPMRPGEASQESRRSRTSILVEEVVPMVDAPRRFCEAICIRLGRRADEQSALQKLRHTMAAHRGECPVLIEVPSGHGGVSTVKVSRDLYVSPTQEFLSEVEGLVGKGCVRSVAARNLAASAEEP